MNLILVSVDLAIKFMGKFAGTNKNEGCVAFMIERHFGYLLPMEIRGIFLLPTGVILTILVGIIAWVRHSQAVAGIAGGLCFAFMVTGLILGSILIRRWKWRHFSQIGSKICCVVTPRQIVLPGRPVLVENDHVGRFVKVCILPGYRLSIKIDTDTDEITTVWHRPGRYEIWIQKAVLEIVRD